MNVAFDPWIPVVTTTGKSVLASLIDVLTQGEDYADVAVRPHERVALMRLFICVAHASLNGPKYYDEWCEVPKKLPESVSKYLMKWKESFELFHEKKPWLQVAGLTKFQNENNLHDDLVDWTPVSKLNFSYATGNNSTLLDHNATNNDRKLELHETILSMITFQCFSPGGLISQVFWKGIKTGKSSKDGPCVTASMLHAFIRGQNLIKTVHLNLPSLDDVMSSYNGKVIGEPIWENPPSSFSDKERVENATQTYLGRLVPMTRLILLSPNGAKMLLGDGLIYPSFTDGFPQEPSATVVIKITGKKEERALLSYKPSKSIWRELASLVTKRRADGIGGPLSLKALLDSSSTDLIVSALARDQATIIDTSESVFHISNTLLNIEGSIVYETEVKNAESVANRLGWAVETYQSDIDGGWEGRLKAAGPAKGELKAKFRAKATIHYWTTVEKNLPLLMGHIEAIGTDEAIPTREKWRKMLFASAREAYSITCGQETTRQMRAFAKGWQKLVSKRNDSEENTTETKEVEA